MTVDQAFNFVAVSESVSTAGLLDERQLSSLREEGYKAVINLLPHDSEYAIEREPDIVAKQGIEYFYVPVDFSAPSEADLDEFYAAMDACRDRKLLIHCAANYRVSAFFGIYAYENLGWSASSARDFISSIWRPDERPPWGEFVSRHLPTHN